MSEFDPIKLAHRFGEAGNSWAEAKAAADVLEKTEKSYRAKLALEYMGVGNVQSKAQMMAEADERYIDYLKQSIEAQKVENLAKVKYDQIRTFVELVRTKESTERALMNLR